MSGRGRGRARSNPGRGRGSKRTSKPSPKSTSSSSKRGLTPALGSHVFDYGDKNCPDLLRTSWEKLCEHVGTTMGPNISTELSTGKKFVLEEPKHDDASKIAHQQAEARRKRKLQRSIEAQEAQLAHLGTLDIKDDPELPTKIADAENTLDDLKEEMQLDKPVEVHGDQKHRYDSEWTLYCRKREKLDLHRGQAFSLILGQCTNTLKEQMKADSSHSKIMTDRDPLALKSMMERTIYSRQDTKYPTKLCLTKSKASTVPNSMTYLMTNFMSV